MLEGLASRRREEYRIEPECIGRCLRDAQVAAMRRIERPSEEGHAPATPALYHSRSTSPVEKMFALTSPPVVAL